MGEFRLTRRGLLECSRASDFTFLQAWISFVEGRCPGRSTELKVQRSMYLSSSQNC